MTKVLKKRHQGVIAQLCSLDVQTSKLPIPLDLQRVIDKHSKVFEDIPKGIPPTQDFDHDIHLIPGCNRKGRHIINTTISKYKTTIKPQKPKYRSSEISR